MNSPEGYTQARPCEGRIGESGVLACPNIATQRAPDGRLLCADHMPVPVQLEQPKSILEAVEIVGALEKALGTTVEKTQRTKRQEHRREKQRVRAKARNRARR